MSYFFAMKTSLLALLFMYGYLSFFVHGQAEVHFDFPRGVHPDLTAFYAYKEKFQCLDGTQSIPYDQVNDDYCDCDDGSDEPGTAACSNASFYCPNAGHAPRILTSSRVNDGICDCCDGSDEWLSNSCTDKCDELGREARIKAERDALVQKEGFAIKQNLIREGREKRAQRLVEIEKLEQELEVAQELQLEKEEKKLNAEELEKEALDKINAEKERVREEEEKRQKIIEEEKATGIFNQLDTNLDGIVSKDEMLQSLMYDQDRDGTVNVEEVEFFLAGSEEYSLEDFLSTGWPMLKPHVEKDDQSASPPSSDGVETVSGEVEEIGGNRELEEGDDVPEEDYDDIGEEDDLRYTEGKDDLAEKQPVEMNKDPEYDEETQRLVDIAEDARTQFEDVRREVQDLESKLKDLKKGIDGDYGEDDEYAALAEQCVEITDHEYTYKLCLFDYASQKPTHGGGETRLGNWDRWENGQMYFSGGQGCWNGPSRSTKVEVRCSTETKLVAVSEPSKCEYFMVLEVPSACQDPKKTKLTHDEL